MSEKKYKDRKWMHEQYIERHKQLEFIALLCGCSRMTVYRWLLKHGVEVRDRIQAVRERFK